jgi:integrating conjugative element protein (TIGR03757 family)
MFRESKLLRSRTLITLALLVTANGAVQTDERLRVEVFTSSDRPIETDFKPGERVNTVDVYVVDGIERIEAGLSRGLPNDPDAANPIVLARIGQMDPAQIELLQRAARGLSRDVQYGLDRYPAIVFDGQAVVYGVADVAEALHRYRQWREDAVR